MICSRCRGSRGARSVLTKARVALTTIMAHTVEISRPLIDRPRPPAERGTASDPGADSLATRFVCLPGSSPICSTMRRSTPTRTGASRDRVPVESNRAWSHVRRRRLGLPARDAADDARHVLAGRNARWIDSQRGLGIGLTVVKRLVQMHGGPSRPTAAGPARAASFSFGCPLRWHLTLAALPPRCCPRTAEWQSASCPHGEF